MTSYVRVFVRPELTAACAQAEKKFDVVDAESYSNSAVRDTARSIARTLKSLLSLKEATQSLGEGYDLQGLKNAVSDDLKEAAESWYLLHQLAGIKRKNMKSGSVFPRPDNSYYDAQKIQAIQNAPLTISNEASLHAALAWAATLEVYSKSEQGGEIARQAADTLTQLEQAIVIYCSSISSTLDEQKNSLMAKIPEFDMIDSIHMERQKDKGEKESDNLVNGTERSRCIVM